MVSESLFNSYPPFPDNVPIASVPKISLSKLIAGDEAEKTLMFEACKALGLFLLDLKHDPVGERFIKTVDTIFEVMKQIFNLSYEEKSRYHVDAKNLVG